MRFYFDSIYVDVRVALATVAVASSVWYLIEFCRDRRQLRSASLTELEQSFLKARLWIEWLTAGGQIALLVAACWNLTTPITHWFPQVWVTAGSGFFTAMSWYSHHERKHGMRRVPGMRKR